MLAAIVRVATVKTEVARIAVANAVSKKAK